jgi:hypothetical protein
LIDDITTSKVSVDHIINNLTTNATNKPLSAAQGVALKALIDGLQSGKLNATDLTSAINTALAQAKASGEFDGKTAYEYAKEGGYAGTEAEFAALLANAVDKRKITLGLHTDGLLYVFIDGVPTGNGIALPSGASGDVVGNLDSENNIILTGNLADGKYTLKYENADGTYTDIGTLEVGDIPEPEPVKTNFFVVGGDGYLNPGRASSSGADRTDVTSCLLSNYIEVQNGDIVSVDGMVLTGNAASNSGFYDTSKTGIFGGKIESATSYVKDSSFSDNGGQFTINNASVGYIRICGAIPSDVGAIVVNIKRNGEWL